MRRKTAIQPEKSSPEDLIMAGFDHNEGALNANYLKGYAERLNQIDLQLASPWTAVHGRPVVTFETQDHIIVYAKIHFRKSMYRKIKSTQLNDQSILECITNLVEQEAEGELNNAQELGNLIRTRILEQAYQVGKERKTDREEAIVKAQNEEPPV